MCGRQAALETDKNTHFAPKHGLPQILREQPGEVQQGDNAAGGASPTQPQGQDIYPLRSSYPPMDFEPFPKGKATGIPAGHVFVLVLETDFTRNTPGKKASFN